MFKDIGFYLLIFTLLIRCSKSENQECKSEKKNNCMYQRIYASMWL